MDLTSGTPATPARRAVVAMAGAAGLTAALAACGGSDSKASDDSGTPSGDSGSGATHSAGGSGGAAPLAKTSDIPEGGGKIFADKKVVVTQPTAGQFKGFSAVCTHAGCTVAQVKDGTINCFCHGSKYRITDGSVTGGPAPRPLPATKITVADGEITLG